MCPIIIVQKCPCPESTIPDRTTISSDHLSTTTEATAGQVVVVGEAVAEVIVVEIIAVKMIDETQIDPQNHAVAEIEETKAHGVATMTNGAIVTHHQHRAGARQIEIRAHQNDPAGVVVETVHPVEIRDETTFGVMIINVMVIAILVAVVVVDEGAAAEVEAASIEIIMKIDGVKAAAEVVVVEVDEMMIDEIVNGVVVVEEHHAVTLLHHFQEYTTLHLDRNGVDRHPHKEIMVVHGENHQHEIQLILPDGAVHHQLRVNRVGVVVNHLLVVVVAVDGVVVVLPVVQRLRVLLKNLAAVAPGVVAVHHVQIMIVVIHGVHQVSDKMTRFLNNFNFS